MLLFYTNLSKTKDLEVVLFNTPRSIKDGVTLFKGVINLDLFKADHKPSFEVLLTLFNVDILHFHIYDRRHHRGRDTV